MGMPLVLKGCGIEPELFESWDEATGKGGGAPRGQLNARFGRVTRLV
jgi:hypothetical protein